MSTESATHRFWDIPELKIFLASHVSRKTDLLHLAQADKATYALLAPSCYEVVQIPFSRIPALAAAFENSVYASRCRALRLDSPEEDERRNALKMREDFQKQGDKGPLGTGTVSDGRMDPMLGLRAWWDDAGHSVSPSEQSNTEDWVMGDEEGDDQAEELGPEDDIKGEDEKENQSHKQNQNEDENEEEEEEYGNKGMVKEEEGSKLGLQNLGGHTDDVEVGWGSDSELEDPETPYLNYLAELRVQQEQLYKRCERLAFVLEKLSEVGGLATFEWVWYPGSWKPNGAPSSVWAALEKHSKSLQHLSIKFFRGDKQTWHPFASENYASLKSLYLDLSNGHYWSLGEIHSMLLHAPKLEALHLDFARCCPPKDFYLDATFPKLRYFSIRLSVLDYEDELPMRFLSRHPLIDTLHLGFTDLCPFELDEDDLPHLRAISYGPDCTLEGPLVEIVSRRPVVVVRCNVDDGLLNFVRGPQAAADTVTHLDVKYRSNFRLDLPSYPEILRTVPCLKELTIRTRSTRYSGRLTRLDLIDLLKALPLNNTTLIAVTLYDPDGDELLPQDLVGLPLVSAALKYFGWEGEGKRSLYRLEREGEETVAIEIPPLRKRGWVWTDASILDHLGEDGRQEGAFSDYPY